jgi:di/tricarboxylate transporter
MTPTIALVFAILGFTILGFLSGRLRLDVVAMLSLLALVLTGVLPVEAALSGFSDPLVLMIAALFVVGDGLFQTGVARAIGQLPARLAGDSEPRLVAVIMVLVALLSAVLSSTGTVAVFLPVVLGLAWGRDISPSKLLIPLSVAALLGGMLSLIGTAPNLVVSNYLVSVGREGFGMFDFTPVGIIMLTAGVLYMVFFGRHLLPDRPSPARPRVGSEALSISDLVQDWDLSASRFRIRIPEGSPLVGRTLGDVEFPDQFGLSVTEIQSGDDTPGFRGALAETALAADDVLAFQGSPDGVHRLIARFGVEVLPESAEEGLKVETGMAELLLTPRSRLLGRTLKDIRFRDRYQLSVVGVKRLGTLVAGDIRDVALRFGDTLLVQGEWDRIRLLELETRDFVVAMAPREMSDALAPLGRAPLAVLILVGMVALLTTGIVAPVTAVLAAALAMILTGCVTVEDAYRSVNWESVVLIAGILPMAAALEVSGAMAWLVGGLAVALDGAGPVLLLATLFLVTSTLSQLISNTATAVLLAPIAYSLALGIGAQPEPFLMAIAVAASTAFASPVASPVTTLVLGPGGYRFRDFVRVGVPLQLIICALAVLVIPRLFPF